jgi:hypothetical protein
MSDDISINCGFLGESRNVKIKTAKRKKVLEQMS